MHLLQSILKNDFWLCFKNHYGIGKQKMFPFAFYTWGNKDANRLRDLPQKTQKLTFTLFEYDDLILKLKWRRGKGFWLREYRKCDQLGVRGDRVNLGHFESCKFYEQSYNWLLKNMGAEGAKLLAVEKSMYNFTVVPFYLLLHIHGLNQTIGDIILSYVFIEKTCM